MSIFLQHVQDLYSTGEYSRIVDELHNFEKDTQKPLPPCIFRELDFALSDSYRQIRDENVFPIRFLWFFELKEQVVMGVVMPLERSHYNPERLYDAWMKCLSNESFRLQLKKDNVLLDFDNKAISINRGWVLVGDTFIEDLIEIEEYWGQQLMVVDEGSGEERPLFVVYKERTNQNQKMKEIKTQTTIKEVNIFDSYSQRENHFTNGLISLLRLGNIQDHNFVNDFFNHLLFINIHDDYQYFQVLEGYEEKSTVDAKIIGKLGSIQFETKIK